MKALLMHRDRDFDPRHELPWNEAALVQDLELNTLFDAMARGDSFLFEIAKTAILSSLDVPDNIVYRQDILKDCLKNPGIVRSLYEIPVEGIETRKKRYWLWSVSNTPSSILSSSVDVLEMFLERLRKLRNIADEHAGGFQSKGFTTLFAMLKRELSDGYLQSVGGHLRELRFQRGVLLSAHLGTANQGIDYVLRKPYERKQGLRARLFAQKSLTYSFTIDSHDEGSGRALEELRNRGINLAANAVARSADHINAFFDMLRTELAFYIGCLNLSEQLGQIEEPIAFPVPAAIDEQRHSFTGLYDVCLALTMKQKIVGSDVNADNKSLVMITGANQGGKSTFLRSVGLAQLMMQCGMFVPAESFSASVCNGVFTHFKREEDVTMESGKLDEELGRMSEIVDHLASNSVLLFNESFSATNEREGSEIAWQITRGLLEKGIKVFFVTHQYEFAHRFYDQKMEKAIFLRADRKADGTRTFKLIEGEPLQTSYGEDLYNRIFKQGGRGSKDEEHTERI
jgi:DNA mismatch repair ATPase MutS